MAILTRATCSAQPMAGQFCSTGTARVGVIGSGILSSCTMPSVGSGTTEELGALANTYGWEIRDWEGLDTLIATRELSGLASYVRTAPDKPFSRHELAHRVDTLRRGEASARWNAPAS
jgi:hypothetical protein